MVETYKDVVFLGFYMILHGPIFMFSSREKKKTLENGVDESHKSYWNEPPMSLVHLAKKEALFS